MASIQIPHMHLGHTWFEKFRMEIYGKLVEIRMFVGMNQETGACASSRKSGLSHRGLDGHPVIPTTAVCHIMCTFEPLVLHNCTRHVYSCATYVLRYVHFKGNSPKAH